MARPTLTLRRNNSNATAAGENPQDDATDSGVELVTHAFRTTVVRVNLLPSEVRDARTLRKVQAGIAVGALVAVAGVGGLWWQEHGKLSSARDDQQAAQDRGAGLHTQVGRLLPVDALFKQVDQAQAMLATTASGNVAWSRIVADLTGRLPVHTYLSSATLGGGGGSSSSTPATSTATSGTAATGTAATGSTISLTGAAGTIGDTADLLDALAASPYLTSVFPSGGDTITPAGASQIVTWTVTATLTPQAILAVEGTK